MDLDVFGATGVGSRRLLRARRPGIRRLVAAAGNQCAVQIVQSGPGDQDGFASVQLLFAFPLFGFGLLLCEFELLVLEAGLHEVGVAVHHLEVQLWFLFQAFDERIGVEAIKSVSEKGHCFSNHARRRS